MKDLLKIKPNNSMRERMLSFYMGHDVVLTDDEEKLKKRLNFIREKLVSWDLTREEIIEEVCEVFTVSRYRAERDIADAYYLFGKSYTVDKNFVAAQLVEDIQRTIKLAKTARKFDILPKLYDSLTKAIQQLPADTGGSVKAKTIKLYKILGNATIVAPLTPAEALQKARDLHKKNIIDIPHEDV